MMMKNSNTTTTTKNQRSSTLGLNKMSQNSSICKERPPKIRIIHIFAPEIIKTDVDNFRELVQRLTGKPSSPASRRTKAKTRSTTMMVAATTREKIKGEDEIWRTADSGGGFLRGLPEFDGGFMEELNCIPFPLLPPLEGQIVTVD